MDDADLRLSVMTVTEVRRGIVRLAKRKAGAAHALAERLDVLLTAYAGRLVAVDRAVADEWGHLQGEKDKHRDDLAFVATARVHDLVLATRNVEDVRGRGVRVLDPFKKSPIVEEV